MRILITGATGFIGRNLFECFSQREDLDVWGVCHTLAPWTLGKMLQGDLTEKESAESIIRHIKPDVLIHAAAVSAGAKYIRENPQALITDSMIMNTRVLEAAHACGVPHVVLLSCTVLYPMNRPLPVKEDSFDYAEIHPLYSGVAIVKVALEGLAKFYADLGKINVTIMRHSDVYGPHDKYDSDRAHMFAAKISEVMRAGDDGVIVMWGSGREHRDLLYISDLVDFIELAIESQVWHYEVFNVGLGEAHTVRDVVQKIIAASRKNLRVVFDTTKPTLPVNLALNISKAKNRLGWEPRVSLTEGIEKTLAWFKSNVSTARM